MFDLTGKRIWVAGHNGMLGRAVCRAVPKDVELIHAPKSKLDLRRQANVEDFIDNFKPDAIIFTAGYVGGVWANANDPAPFICDNLAMVSNLVQAAHKADINHIIYFGSACVYPVDAPQPLQPQYLFNGKLEMTNRPYAVAKLAGAELLRCYRAQYGRAYCTLMPCNLYGPYDNFDHLRSHVIPALIKKFAAAMQEKAAAVEIWGTGAAKREFMHVDDCARAAWFFLKNHPDCPVVNVGTGDEISVLALAEKIADICGFGGDIISAPHMLEGAPRRLLDSCYAKTCGWKANISLDEGLKNTLDWFLSRSDAT